MKIYTIGHSIHSKVRFTEMLQVAGIDVLADVRAFPASRKHPQFSKENMQEWLSDAGIQYMHFKKLAGRRNKSEEIEQVLNDGWDNQSFHNYADYTLTDEFQKGIRELTQTAHPHTVAYCCSERHPSRCHRLLISNWLAANGWEVAHIMESNNETQLVPHKMGRWGAMPVIEYDGTVVYPKV